MKITQKDFDKLVQVRAEEELRKTGAGKSIAYMWVGAFAASLALIEWVSVLGGILLFVVCFLIGLAWSRRKSKKMEGKIRVTLLQEWKGNIEG